MRIVFPTTPSPSASQTLVFRQAIARSWLRLLLDLPDTLSPKIDAKTRLAVDATLTLPTTNPPIRVAWSKLTVGHLHAAAIRVRRILRKLRAGRRLHVHIEDLRVHAHPDADHLRIFFTPRPNEDALVLMTLLLLEVYPFRYIGECRYADETHRQPCGRLFLKVKNQRWCAIHRVAARRQQLREAKRAARGKTRGAGR